MAPITMAGVADDDTRRFDVLLEDIAKQVRVVAEGYGTLNAKVDVVTAQLHGVDLKLDRLDIRAGALENRLGAVENRVAALEQRLPNGVPALSIRTRRPLKKR